MLVPNFPNFSLEPCKPVVQCVCGCSSLATLERGEKVKYCPACAKKRATYTKKITGEIHFDENISFAMRFLNSIEELRKKETDKIIYKRIDCFFAQRADENYEEPYEDSSFTVSMYREKLRVVDQFSEEVGQHCNSNINSPYYQMYQKELLDMKKNDMRCILDLENSKGRSNFYIKKR